MGADLARTHAHPLSDTERGTQLDTAGRRPAPHHRHCYVGREPLEPTWQAGSEDEVLLG